VESANSCDVLDRHVPRSKLAHDSSELGPQRSLRMAETSARAGVRSALAGEAAGDAVDGLKSMPRRAPLSGSDIIVNRDSWPPSFEEGSPVGLTLDEPGVPDPCLVESGVEESGA
jgi:hypothetical protein